MTKTVLTAHEAYRMQLKKKKKKKFYFAKQIKTRHVADNR